MFGNKILLMFSKLFMYSCALKKQQTNFINHKEKSQQSLNHRTLI